MSPNGGIARCPLTTTWTACRLPSRVLLPASGGYAPAPVAPLPSGMWQPWQTLAYRSSPLCSENLKPALGLDPGELGAAFCASAAGDISDSNVTMANGSNRIDDI